MPGQYPRPRAVSRFDEHSKPVLTVRLALSKPANLPHEVEVTQTNGRPGSQLIDGLKENIQCLMHV